MRPEFGNAVVAGDPTREWIVGRFVDESTLRRTDSVEVKWGVHHVGESSDWKSQPGKRTIALLVSGQLVIHVRSGGINTFTLQTPGDYVVWDDSEEHQWEVIVDNTVVVTVRWPAVIESGRS